LLIIRLLAFVTYNLQNPLKRAFARSKPASGAIKTAFIDLEAAAFVD